MHTRLITLSGCRSLVFLSLLAACEGITKPAAPPDPSLSVGMVRRNITYPLELTFDCTAAGGEIIDVSGTVHETLTIVVHDDGSQHFTVAVAGQGLTGIGRSTGATYRVPGTGVTNTTLQLQPPGEDDETFVLTGLNLTRLVQTGPGADGTLWGTKFVQHLTITSTGQFIDNTFEASECVEL